MIDKHWLVLQCLKTIKDMHSHTFFSLSQLAKKSCKIPTTTITPSPVTRGRYRLSNTGHKHKCDGHTWTKGREIWGHGRERRNHQNRNCGSTSRCTTTMFTFLQRAQWGYPSGFERRCHGQQKKKKKKRGGGKGKQSSIWHIWKQQRVLFDRMLGSEKSAHRAAGSLTAKGS